MTTPKKFKTLMEKVDLDGNGTVSFSEFKAFVENAAHSDDLAFSLRKKLIDNLVELEDAVLCVVQPYFTHGGEPSLNIKSATIKRAGDSETFRPVSRLNLSRRAKACSVACGLIVLLLVFMLAFVPVLVISDYAVSDRVQSSSNTDLIRKSGGALSSSHANFDADKLTTFDPQPASECIDFAISTCGWKGGQFTKTDFRECSKKVHPDKKGGSAQDFRKLHECSVVLTQARSVCFYYFMSAAASFCVVFTFIAGLSSCTSAVVFAMASIEHADILLGPAVVGVAPDLAESLRAFVAVYALGLVVLVVALVRFRRQTSLAEWLSGSHVCMLDGAVAVWWLLFLRDATQGALDVAAVVALSWFNGESLKNPVHFMVNMCIQLFCLRPMLYAIEIENRNFLDLLFGTAVLSEVRQKMD
jgi:hypothetical protein